MCNRHYNDLVLSSVVDDKIWITVKSTVLATGIGPRIALGVGSNQFNGRIDFGCKSNCCPKTSLGVPIKGIIELCTCRNIEINGPCHDRSGPEPPCG